MLLSDIIKYTRQPIIESYQSGSPFKKYGVIWKEDELSLDRHDRWMHSYVSYSESALVNEWMQRFTWTKNDSLEYRQEALGYSLELNPQKASFSQALHFAIPETEHISIDQAKDSDFETISPEKAMSRKHAKDLMFWEYESGKLAAVSFGTKIAILIYQTDEEYTPNQNYEPENLENIDSKSPQFENSVREWVRSAYDKKSRWQSIVGQDAVKECMGRPTVSAFSEMLQTANPRLSYGAVGRIAEAGVARVRVLSRVDLDGKLTDSAKIESRHDWHEFINNKSKKLAERLLDFKVKKAQSGRSALVSSIMRTLNDSAIACGKYQFELNKFVFAMLQNGGKFEELAKNRITTIYDVIERVTAVILDTTESFTMADTAETARDVHYKFLEMRRNAEIYNNSLEDFENNQWIFDEVQKIGGPSASFAADMLKARIDVDEIDKFRV